MGSRKVEKQKRTDEIDLTLVPIGAKRAAARQHALTPCSDDDVIFVVGSESKGADGARGRADDDSVVGSGSKRIDGARGRVWAEDDSVIIVVEEGSSQDVRLAMGGRGSSGGRKRTTSVGLTKKWLRPANPSDCPICLCEFEVDEGVVLTACSHEFCETCITTYVQNKVKDGEVLPQQMSCPHAEPKPCGVSLSPSDILQCLPDKVDQERFQRLSLQRSFLLTAPARTRAQITYILFVVSCLRRKLSRVFLCASCVESGEDMGCCPTAGCPFSFVWDEDNRKLSCPVCSKSFCLVCRCEPWQAPPSSLRARFSYVL